MKTMPFIIPIIFITQVFCASNSSWEKAVQRKVTGTEDRILQEQHLLFKDGKVYKVDNGEPVALQNEVHLNNGTIVHPDGKYELKDKRQFVLSDGECLDMNGSHYLNQKMLLQKRPMSVDEVQKSRAQANQKSSEKGKQKN